MTDAILQHREARVLTLQLNRPDKKNALTRAMYSHLAQALEQADADPNIHAVLIQAAASVLPPATTSATFSNSHPVTSTVRRFTL